MDALERAKKEIDILIEQLKKSGDEMQVTYTSSCCDSALKAYECLAEDGHSGMSINVTLGLLNRLVEGKPLTAIKDDDSEVWEESHSEDGMTTYQCERMTSLFKTIAPDGSVTYTDVNRVICKDYETGSTYTTALVRDTIDEMYPIEMPYYPSSKAYTVVCRDCLTDAKYGDLDTFAMLHVNLPDGTTVRINRYFKSADSGWVEIDEQEFLERWKLHRERLEALEEEAKEETNE